MKTRLTELLNIKYPVIQGPMAWVSESRLAIAVAEAGGIGIIASGGRDSSWVREEIRAVRKATAKPFGVNVTLLAENKEELIETAVNEKVPLITLGAGNPLPYIEMIKRAGIKVFCVVPNLKLAKRVEQNGVDAVIIEGMESGGHIGSLTTMALMTQVIPEVKIPVIVAGGIADGRGMAAALLMGASGIQMGTAFLVSEECQVHPNLKEKILGAIDTDSVATGLSRGSAARGIKNAFTEQYLALERSGAPQTELDKFASGRNRLASVQGDVENGSVQAGQSLTVLKEIKPVKRIIEDIVQEAVENLKKAPTLVQ